MNAVIALCHFCELHGPSVLFTTQSYHSLDPKHVLECDENAPDGVSYYIKERSLRSTSSDDGSLSKAVKSDTCEACRSLSSGQSGYISNDHRAHVSYVSTQYPDHPQVFAMVRQACVRSLSCEVCPGREGPIFFGDDTRGHVFSYTFYIQDAQARGFTRWYSVIVAMMDKTYLLNSWPFLVQHVRKFVAWLQAKARVVHDSEQARCPQRAQRLSSSMTPSNFRQHRGENIPARSLSDLTNDKSVFRNLHVRFSWLLKHCGSRLTEKLLEGPPTEDSMIDTEIDDDLSEDSVSAVTPDLDFDPDRPEHVENPCHVETTCADDATTGNVFEATSQVRGYEEPAFHNIRHVVKVLGEDKFHTLSHHVLIGNQLVVRSNQSTITSSLIHCLKALLPKGCCRAINYSSTYEDSWRCSFIGLPKTVPIPPHVLSSELHLVVEVKSRNVSETADRVENFHYGLHSEALLPERGPIILTKMEKVIANRELSDDVVEQCIICLKEEWMNKVKAVFMFSKTGTSRTEAENNAQKSCGLGKWYRPGWIQRFATIRWFTAFSAFYGFCFGIFPLYTVSQVTAFEKHFDLSSQRSGLIVSGAEIGFIFSALVIGYFSNHYHRPRILGYCTVLICAGCLVADVPFYLDIANNRQTTPAHLRSFNSTCGASRNSAVCDDVTALGRDDVTSSFWYIFAGTVLYGAGSCGMWTIGVSYIDDNADSKKAYLYVGLVICIRFLAPVGGLMLGAAVAPVPVHITDTGGSPEDVDWVGAWWIGYYLIFGLVLISSLPFWCYPKVLCNVDEPSDRMSRRVYTVATQEYAADNDAVDDVGEAPPDGTRTNYNESPSKSTEKLEEMDIRECAGEKTNMGQLLKGFPSALWRLLRNPIFMCGSLATSLDFSISIGFGAFVPKFFETYFHTTAAVANAVTGVALAFSACIGSGLGGYLMSRVKWRLNRMLLVATIVNMGICVLIGPILLLKCPSVRMVGIHDSGSTTNLSRSCNHGCDCETSLYSPVCDGQTAFFSPCHAGCTNRYQNGSFSECACTPNSSDLLMPGLCERQCTLEMALYAILLFVLVMCLSAAEIPAYMLNIRSVGESDKALGLAILNVFTSAFAFPMPILFGWMVDGACVAVQKFACADGAACALYDNEQLKYRLHLLPAGLKIVPTVVYTLAWYLSRDATFAGDEVAPTAAMDENTTSAVYDNQTLDHEDEINTKI